MTSDAIVQVAVCAYCNTRLVVIGTPCRLGESATFSVSCSECRARIRLTFAVGAVTSVVIEEACE
jgi:hypothetical protein